MAFSQQPLLLIVSIHLQEVETKEASLPMLKQAPKIGFDWLCFFEVKKH